MLWIQSAPWCRAGTIVSYSFDQTHAQTGVYAWVFYALRAISDAQLDKPDKGRAMLSWLAM